MKNENNDKQINRISKRKRSRMQNEGKKRDIEERKENTLVSIRQPSISTVTILFFTESGSKLFINIIMQKIRQVYFYKYIPDINFK
jgi:hypothetical protein